MLKSGISVDNRTFPFWEFNMHKPKATADKVRINAVRENSSGQGALFEFGRRSTAHREDEFL